MPMYDSLADQIKYFLLNGASYDVAPDLGADVLDQVDAFLARFISYPDEHARHAHVLWIAHCWLTDCFGHTPRLLFISPEPGCGKTHALTVTGCLVPRPEHVANLSAAGLYYSIDEALERKGGRPTILYDELDSVFGNAEVGRIRNEEIRSLINAGHGPRSETLVRKIGKETKRFQLYSPMALAGITVPDTYFGHYVAHFLAKHDAGDIAGRLAAWKQSKTECSSISARRGVTSRGR